MDDDPGWPFTPGFMSNRSSGLPGETTRRQPSDLVGLRVIFSSFVTGVTLFGIVVLFLVMGAKPPPGDQTLPAIVFVVLALAIAVAGGVFVKKLDSSSEKALVASFRGRVIIQAATAEGATLLLLVAAMATAKLWMVAVAALVGVVAFARAAPTQQAIQRDQEMLQVQGSPYSLMEILTRPPTPAQDRQQDQPPPPPPPPPR